MYEESADYIMGRLGQAVQLQAKNLEPLSLDAQPLDQGVLPSPPPGWDGTLFQGGGWYVLFRFRTADVAGLDMTRHEVLWRGSRFEVRVSRSYCPDGQNAMFQLAYTVAAQSGRY